MAAEAPQAPDTTVCMRTFEVARRLGISQKTVLRLLRAKILPGIKIGRSWVVPRAELERYLADLKEKIERQYEQESRAS